MIRRLSGTLVDRTPDAAVVSCGGVGFAVHVPKNAVLPPLGSEVTLWTYLRVREDALDLFGFLTADELELFELMQKIRGFPARTALAVLGHCGIEGFRAAVAGGDLDALTAVPGVGKKLAQQLLLDLKGAIDLDELRKPKSSEKLDDATLALMELGYREEEAIARVQRVREEHKGIKEAAEIVRLALKS